MANCPNCGSSHVQLQQRKDVNWGRAVAGWALFGVLGGAVGAITGEDRNTNVCLDCGTSWRAGDLYKTLQLIQQSTGVSLDLSQEKHRDYMNNFMTELTPYLDEITNKENTIKKIENEIKAPQTPNTGLGCGAGCLVSFAGCSLLSATAATGGMVLLTVLIPPIVGGIVGQFIDNSQKKSVKLKQTKALKQAKAMKIEAEDNYRENVKQFMNSHDLENS